MITTLLLAAVFPQIGFIDHTPESARVSVPARTAPAQAADQTAAAVAQTSPDNPSGSSAPDSFQIINGTVLIVNDQVLTELEIHQLMLQMKLDPNFAGAGDAMLYHQASLDLAQEVLFSEGATMSGFTREIITPYVMTHFQDAVQRSGSIPAYQQHLAKRGTNMQAERDKLFRSTLSDLYQGQIFGYQPVNGKRFLEQIYSSPEAIFASYHEDPSRFHQPAAVTAQIIMVADNKQPAEKVIRQLREEILSDASTFDTVAKTHSLYHKDTAGLTESIDPSTSSFSPPVREYLAVGEVGVVSEPITDGRLWYLVKILESNPAGIQSFDKAQALIRQELKNKQRAQILFDSIQSLRKKCHIWLSPNHQGLLDMVEFRYAQALDRMAPPEEGTSF